MILLGDCLERLKEMEANSVDAVVTDPPYGLKFMGKRWDYDLPSVAIWLEVCRVLKPGGHLLSFGGTRTYHRLVVAIEDAGFEIRDQLQWLYGSGFPKSLDISKAIDKAAGAEREVIGKKSTYREPQSPNGWDCTKRAEFETAPATPEAYRYKGWGTALKPANEPICLARKPLEKGLTVAQNMLKWGVGGLNIDESRIASDEKLARPFNEANNDILGKYQRFGNPVEPQGRWPANLLLDETAAEMLDEQSGLLKTNPGKIKSSMKENIGYGGYARIEQEIKATSGGASRFFYVAKASKRERNAGLEGMPEKEMPPDGPLAWGVHNQTGKPNKPPEAQRNAHPTVKPIKLMEYLCKLICPPGGTILDPFAGSGSTLVAAFRLGYKAIGIEMSEEYCEIARKRIEHAKGESA